MYGWYLFTYESRSFQEVETELYYDVVFVA